MSLVLSLTSARVSPQFHVGHDNYFKTTRKNRSSVRTNRKCQQLSGIDLAVKIEKRDKINRPELTKFSDAKPNATAGKPPDVSNLVPIFEPTRTTSLEKEGTFDQVAYLPVQDPEYSAQTP